MLDRNNVLHQIAAAEIAFQRPAVSVALLAVAKGQSIEKIQTLYAQGQRAFAENYLQEALEKMAALKAFAIEWHFIGVVQSNKTKLIAENFAWVQSVASVKIAERLNRQRPAQLPPLNICLQVNITDESIKYGAKCRELLAIAKQVMALPNLKLRGLLFIPTAQTQFELQLDCFKRCALLFDQLRLQCAHVDTLSMGMSGDFKAAIAAGSTMVRIGSALFGKRGER